MSNEPENCIRCGDPLWGWNCGDEWRHTGICCDCWTDDDADPELDNNGPQYTPWNIGEWG